MRKLIVAAGLAALAVPAAAQPRHPADGDVARRLPPPGEIDAIGVALERVADAVMAVDIGPIADAVDPGRPHPHRTVGEMASRDDPYARERIRDSIAASTVGLRVALDRIAVLEPVLRRSIEDTRRQIDDAMRGRDYRRPPVTEPDRDWDRDRDVDVDRDRDRDVDVDRDEDRDPNNR